MHYRGVRKLEPFAKMHHLVAQKPEPFAEVHHRRAQKLEPFAKFPRSVGGPAECADLGVEVCLKRGKFRETEKNI